MRTPRTIALAALLLAGCGGGSKPSVAPSVATRSVTFVAFLDENRNAVLDPSELIRIPGAEVDFGGVSGKSAASTGEVSLNVPQAAEPLSVNGATLPPYYVSPPSSVLSPPVTGTLNVPITLPLGATAAAGVFLAFGDSITDGQAGVGDGQGYTGQLERMLSAHFGKARVINDGIDSSNTERGDSRIEESLAGGRPAFTLLLYGTNDWSDLQCREPPCYTITNLRSMVRKVKARGGFPFVGTLLMTSPGNDFRASVQRNEWIAKQNDFIRQMAIEEDVALVDLHAAFEHSPLSYSELFADYIHPSAEGYKLMAQTWFDAITKRR